MTPTFRTMLPYIFPVILHFRDEHFSVLSPGIDDDTILKTSLFGRYNQNIVFAPVFADIRTCKMETEVRASQAVTVSEVNVKVGDSVTVGQALITLL